ncbi:MAG: phenylalanine--tRNA ligase subunit beta [Planctomycetes bacterium]|nr:phenylalanine--tRNA ligase subunit beta [Planctomycetota bacterium]
MKISLNWLNDYVDLSDVAPERVSELLSLHTAEVEGIEVFGEAIQDVVVGFVVECEQHPAADKLSVTQVEYGGDEVVTVVCGASNVRQGLKIAFAPVGSRLPGDFKIKKAKLRGVESRGMICSEKELELSDSHAGIMELPDDAPVGKPLIQYLGILDHVLELDNKSLTHRPDLWGHYGFARELAAILQRDLKPLPVAELAKQDVATEQGDALLGIKIQDQEGCAFYAGLPIELDGPPKASPDWLQRRLLAVGQRPLDDLVDLSNYILLELGQPTHAFDLDHVAGKQIQVRAAHAGEVLRTLDDQDRHLQSSDLVIADANKAIALAGVMGGQSSEVSETTSRILLESAVFHATRVRRTSHRLALRTDASARFEKSLDPSYAMQSLQRFAYLLKTIRPEAKILGPALHAGCDVAPQIELSLNPVRTAELLGLDLSAERMLDILQRLGFEVCVRGELLTASVPTWRATKDVTTAIDLVEEIGRLAGYHNIKPEPLHAPIEVPRKDHMRELCRKLSNRLSGAHQAYETQGYTFLQEEWAQRLGMDLSDFVRVDNPVQDGLRLIRRDPIPSILDQVAGNRREHGDGCLFEIGKGYEPVETGLPTETRWLAAVLWQSQSQAEHGPGSAFGSAKTMAEDLLRSVGISDLVCGAKDSEVGAPKWAHPVRSMALPQNLGWIAAIHPSLCTELGLVAGHVTAICLDLAAVLALSQKQKSAFIAPSRFPGIKVDVALALPKNVPFSEVQVALQKAGGKTLASLVLFDLFEGGSLASDQRSLAFHALLRAQDRTLSDKDEQKFLQKVAQTAERLGGSLRS